MSIFSGFGTRQQENSYNALVENTIFLMQNKVVANIKNEPVADPVFKMQLLKNYDNLVKLEVHKYLLPKFSEAIKDIVLFIIREQVNSPVQETNLAKDRENMKKTTGSLKNAGAYSERSLTPTLPVVRFSGSKKNLTPGRSKKSESGFLYARLKNN